MPSCPVCSGSTIHFATYAADDIVRNVEHALGRSGLQRHVKYSFQMLRCSTCSLEFCDPMIEPGSGFYQWLTASGFAYPENRWEWSACWEWISDSSFARDGRNCTVLDVGCGSGGFLEWISNAKGVRAIGIDHNPDVISMCRSKGLEAFVGDLDAITHAINEPVDIVTLWHVVEHSANPLKVLNDAQGILSSRGVICFSVPLSPMSYEAAWTDPFNGPPHHLTRWNEHSLRALAIALRMDIELILPEPEGVMRRAVRALLLQAGASQPGLGSYRKLGILLGLLIRRPGQVLTELRRQRSAPMLAGRARPDVALIVLKRK